MQNFRNRRPPKSTVFCEPPKPCRREECRAEFSPLLASLLSCTLRDGLCNHTSFLIFRDMYPFVSAHDRRVIDGLIECQNIAGDIASRYPVHILKPYSMRRALTGRERFLGMLRVLRKYGGRETDCTFSLLERYIGLSERFGFGRQFRKNDWDGTHDLVKHISDGRKGGERMNDMANMMQMLSMLGAMGNRMGGGRSEDGGGNAAGMGNMENMMRMMSMLGAMNNGGGAGAPSGEGGFDMAKAMQMMSMLGAMNNGGGASAPAGEGGFDMAKAMQMMSMLNTMNNGGGAGAPAGNGNVDMAQVTQMMNMLNAMGGMGKDAPADQQNTANDSENT